MNILQKKFENGGIPNEEKVKIRTMTLKKKFE
jgi:hypothetical protein